MSFVPKMTRRRLLIGGAAVVGGALILGFYISGRNDGLAYAEAAADDESVLNAWVKISADGMITVAVPQVEMGQGVQTSLPMLLAEELDADWNDVRSEQAPVTKVYANIGVILRALDESEGWRVDTGRWAAKTFGGMLGVQITAGSSSIRNAWEPMRLAGAAAREMLIQAAAERLDVPAASLVTRRSEVIHEASGRRSSYGELAAAAVKFDPPDEPRLKTPDQFTIIGKPIPRLDIPAKVDGTAKFGIDVRLPGMLYATLKVCPVFGGTIASFYARGALAMPGVVKVLEVPDGVAVVADSYWHARTALEKVAVQWDEGEFATQDSAAILESFMYSINGDDGEVYRDTGDSAAALATADRVVEATYTAPLLAHACMDPMNATAQVSGGKCNIWMPNQSPSLVKWIASNVADLDGDDVTVHTTLLGGGFGRRAETDLVAQVVAIAKALDGRPVQLLWSREEDVQHDIYRPAAAIHYKGALDAEGRPTAWTSRSASQSMAQSFFARILSWWPTSSRDDASTDGNADHNYDIPNQLVEHVIHDLPVPVGFWRSIGASYNAFFKESFVDELAHAAGQDPYRFRRSLLDAQPRERAVLDAAAEISGWGQRQLPQGWGRGIALHKYAATIVAEVSVGNGGELRVHQVYCVVDPGVVVNPDTIVAQMQSAIVYGLSAALYGEITLRGGRVEQENFSTTTSYGSPICRVSRSRSRRVGGRSGA